MFHKKRNVETWLKTTHHIGTRFMICLSKWLSRLLVHMLPIQVMCVYVSVKRGSGAMCIMTGGMQFGVDLSLGWFMAFVQQATGAAVIMQATWIISLASLIDMHLVF